MPTEQRRLASDPIDPMERLARYPLLDALIHRRSRRFGKGMRLNGGPLAYTSAARPRPLGLGE
jgi:hypothetical protein